MLDATDVVVMAVRNYDAFNPFGFVAQIGNIRDNIINAGHVLFRKLQAHINNNYFFFVFDYGHVAADFFQSAQNNDAQFAVRAFKYFFCRRFDRNRMRPHAAERRERTSFVSATSALRLAGWSWFVLSHHKLEAIKN